MNHCEWATQTVPYISPLLYVRPSVCLSSNPRAISQLTTDIAMSSKSLFEYNDEGGKFAKKAKDSPFMIIGMAGFVAAGAYGAYRYRSRGQMSTSVFLMQLRVGAQATVVGSLCLGLAYTMANEYVFNKKPKSDSALVH